MVDRAALEMRSTGNRTGGSNPSLSAKCQLQIQLRICLNVWPMQGWRGTRPIARLDFNVIQR